MNNIVVIVIVVDAKSTVVVSYLYSYIDYKFLTNLYRNAREHILPSLVNTGKPKLKRSGHNKKT